MAASDYPSLWSGIELNWENIRKHPIKDNLYF